MYSAETMVWRSTHRGVTPPTVLRALTRQSGYEPVRSSLVEARGRAVMHLATLGVLCVVIIFLPDDFHVQVGRGQLSVLSG